ncbi:MAG: phosphoenolpyruvate synthase/pyruvate phosphate dikinase [Desulfobacteraceae bacterium]|nr:MAG: phosphoenolpyruvate synthase/pyruvate phosphate dikinase [Desulfobacteraceae bacterium]
MAGESSKLPSEFYSQFKIFHELMQKKVREILLVSSPYDAFIVEEDGSLAQRIINEYSGLNLSHPPRVTRKSSASEALALLKLKKFDLVITMPHLQEMDAFSLGLEIKKSNPTLPVNLLSHSPRGIYPPPEDQDCSGIDRTFIWSGNSDLLLALVKNVEDRLNVDTDTQKAMVRVLILVEDSPVYYSSFLPYMYKEVVRQTLAVLDVGLNEDHRLLRMRTRPKILLATNYEQAVEFYEKYKAYLLGVISDTRFPRKGVLVNDAGRILLSRIREEIPDLPLLLVSSQPENRQKAEEISAAFLDKNSSNLMSDLHRFIQNDLGFGDFIFRLPDGREIDRASDLRMLESKLAVIPGESLCFHARRNHFSRWIMSRSETSLASILRKVQEEDFEHIDEMRDFIISNIHTLRKWQQKGVVARFNSNNYDADVNDLVKIGQGSLGGKARSLAFMAVLLQQESEIHARHPGIDIKIPRSLVICTDVFEDFVNYKNLRHLANEEVEDQDVAKMFLSAELPGSLVEDLKSFLLQVRCPLSVRSSSLLEDAQFQPYAGLYATYMIPNNHPDDSVRLFQLLTAVQLVYASTYYQGPKAFSKSLSYKPQEEAMAVIIQELAGEAAGDYFYPSLSGVAQSHNFYPVGHMKSEEGIVHIALGMGKTVVEGGRSLRFSPKYPNMMPQFSSVDDILKNSQRFFYALKILGYPEKLNFQKNSNLEKREVEEAEAEYAVRTLASTYIPEEHRIRDSGHLSGPKVMTFAQILKHNLIPLPSLLSDMLELGRKGMGCPIEMEFSANIYSNPSRKSEFFFLQMRPMAEQDDRIEIKFTAQEISDAFCRSGNALGNGKSEKISDIVYVKPLDFKTEATLEISAEIGRINAGLLKESRPYLLVGPGRWGTSDRWLGIPVRWQDISGVGAMIEVRNEKLRADPSQGSHFFQNITSLGIPYVTVTEGTDDYFDWKWIDSVPAVHEARYIRHIRLKAPFVLKIDGKSSQCIMVQNS